MKNVLFFILGLFLCVNSSFAQEKDYPRPPGKMMDNLELTAEQESKISDLHLQLRKEIIPLQSEIERVQSDINLELTSENFSEGKIKKFTEDVARLQKEIQFKRIMNERAIRNLLTTEQKKKFDLQLLSRRDFRGREEHRFQRNSHRPQQVEPADK
jgi:Spy/CpxP family protein refolding chaperone